MTLNPEQVAQYLKAHPEFFEQNLALLTELQLTHPHGGRAVSITERQVLALREKVRALESRLAELIRFAEENDAIGAKVHHLSLALMGRCSLDAAIDTLYLHLRDDFAVPHTTLRLWCPLPPGCTRPEFAEVVPEIRQFAAAMPNPYCGQHAVYEVNRWFGEAAPHLRSFAMVPLRSETTFGLLLLASEDAQRFYPEMGTLYLNRIGQLASAALLPYLGEA